MEEPDPLVERLDDTVHALKRDRGMAEEEIVSRVTRAFHTTPQERAALREGRDVIDDEPRVSER